MSHNDYSVPYSFWHGAKAPTPSTLRKMDSDASKALNGEAGGVWTPSSPIVFGGQGIVCLKANFQKGVKTNRLAADGALVLGDFDWPKHIPAKTRRVVFPIYNDSPNDFFDEVTDTSTTMFAFDSFQPGGNELPGSSDEFLQVPSVNGFVFRIPHYRLINGSRISSVKMQYRVNSVWSNDTFDRPYVEIFGHNSISSNNFRYVASIPDWMSDTAYDTIDENRVVQVGADNPLKFFKVATAGTSGATEPAGFATAIPDVTTGIVDGTVVWNCISTQSIILPEYGYGRIYSPFTSRFDHYGGGVAQEVSLINPNVGSIVEESFEYFVRFSRGSNTHNTLHSIIIEFINIGDLRPGV